jgi:uncharacterized protein
VLVYAHRDDQPRHAVALAALTRLAESSEPWAIPVFCLTEFLRVVTHPKIFRKPHTAQEGVRAIENLLASPSVQLLNPGHRFPEFLAETTLEVGAVGNLVFDVQIVALCREHGVREILTEDRDFDRFRRLRVRRLSGATVPPSG